MSQEDKAIELEKQEAKAKLKERFGESTRTGGKGNTFLPLIRNHKKEEEGCGKSK